MKKLALISFLIPALAFGQKSLSNSLDSQFRRDISKARSENGFSVSPDKKLDELAKRRVLSLKKIFQDNWNKGVNSSPEGFIFIGSNHFCYGYNHGLVQKNIPAGFIYNKKDSALLPFADFEESISGVSYSQIEENHTYPIILSKNELEQMAKKLIIPRGYFSIFEHYKKSQHHYESIIGISMKDNKDRKFGSYAEIFEVEEGKYILFHVAIFTSN